jgi:hypothetical protein
MQCIEDLQYGRHKNGIVYQHRKVIVTETVLDISSKYERLRCGSKDALLLQPTFPNTSKSIETTKDKVAKAEETLDIESLIAIAIRINSRLYKRVIERSCADIGGKHRHVEDTEQETKREAK